MKIKVKDLLPNPFRNIEAYPIDPEKIRQLRNSIRETTFWDNILARPAPNNGRYQIAYGHHRLTAIKEELGKDTVVDIPVRDLSDEDMLRIMANENMQEWSTDWRVIVETVREAKKFLEKHIELAKKHGGYKKGYSEVGKTVISRFLGENWPESRISKALAIIKDKEIQITFREKREKIRLDITTLERISSIKDKEAKKQWIEETVKKDIGADEITEITRFENDPTLTSQDKETLRALVQQDELRGKEQIRRKHQIYKAQRLTMPKTSPERERQEKQLEEHLLEIAKQGSHLAELISTLAGQISSHPDTLELFPREETAKANSAMHDLLRAIRDYREKFEIAKSKMKEKTDIKEAAIEGGRVPQQ